MLGLLIQRQRGLEMTLAACHSRQWYARMSRRFRPGRSFLRSPGGRRPAAAELVKQRYTSKVKRVVETVEAMNVGGPCGVFPPPPTPHSHPRQPPRAMCQLAPVSRGEIRRCATGQGSRRWRRLATNVGGAVELYVDVVLTRHHPIIQRGQLHAATSAVNVNASLLG